jgi:ribosomal protein L40E
MCGYQTDLCTQRLHISRNQIRLTGISIEIAITAAALAKGNMDIDTVWLHRDEYNMAPLPFVEGWYNRQGHSAVLAIPFFEPRCREYFMSPERVSKQTKICPTCGTRVSEDAARCLVCGTNLTPGERPSRQTKVVQGSRMPEITLSLPAMFGILLVFLAVGAAFVYFAFRQRISSSAAAASTPTATAAQSPTATLTPTPETPTPTNTPLPAQHLPPIQ